MLVALRPHSRFLQSLDSLDGLPTHEHSLNGLLEYVQEGTIQWTESFLRACQYYIIEPPIEEAVALHIRIHGSVEHATLLIRLGLCEPSIVDWFHLDPQKKIDQGILFGVDEPKLWEYAKYGHLEVVKYLVSQGADIHANNERALRRACEEGHLDVVKYLVEQGANIHADNEYALHWASRKGHLEVVKYLVSQGADVHARDELALQCAS